MAGPWERYQQPEADGPWARYAQEAPKEEGGGFVETVGRAARLLNPAAMVAGLATERGRADAANHLAGGVRGAGSIGATAMYPFEGKAANEQRRAAMDSALTSMGADTQSLPFQTGKLATEVGGTAGVGNALALPFRGSPAIAAALQSGGLRAPGLSGIPEWATRIGAGAVTGGAAAWMVDPRLAPTGAMLGGALPPVVAALHGGGARAADAIQGGAHRLMQSSLKPTIKQLQSGDAAVATRVMLDEGLSPNTAGVEKLRALADQADDKITAAIAQSPAQVDKAKVAAALGDTRATFGNQVSPAADLQAIDGIEAGFMNHPRFAGQTIPVKDAQELKRGTYSVLKKKYGQMGGAETEAQKALARGLKDEIAAAVPDVAEQNALLSDYIRALEVAKRRALMDANKNPAGLALLAPSQAGFAAFLADRSAVLKSLVARGMHQAAPYGRSVGLLDDPALLPVVRGGLLANGQ